MRTLFLLFPLICTTHINAQIITTVAGSAVKGYGGDDQPATTAKFNFPTYVALDASGNMYIADTDNQRVCKITAGTGILNTIAGTTRYINFNPSYAGYSGDGGLGRLAELNNPNGIVSDPSGNLYVADKENNCIRKVSAGTGIITTIAGNGTAGYSGDEGPANLAQLKSPACLAIDASANLYIADRNNFRIRKITAATGIITTIAGNGQPGYDGDGKRATHAALYFPSGLALDASGNLYFADEQEHCIRKVTAETGIITTIAGNGRPGYSGEGGPANLARFNTPMGLALDPAGNLYIADRENNRICKITVSTGIISTIAGTGLAGYTGDGKPATDAQLNDPIGLTFDPEGNLYFTDMDNHCVRKITHVAEMNKPKEQLQ